MKSALVCLNLIVERGAHCEVTPEDARIAIHAIETQALVIGALRLVLDNPNPSHPANVAARDHAKKLLELHDAYVAKHATKPPEAVPLKPVDSAPAKKSVAEQDVADLV